jgi:hypothetical protein
METCIFMTVTKRKITEVESIVNKADNVKTAGKIYLPKDWIGKKVKSVLLSSLIVIAVVVFIPQQQVKAELTFKETLYVDNIARHEKINLQLCNGVLNGDPAYPESDLQSKLNMTKTAFLITCDDEIPIVVGWCKLVGEQGDRFRKSGLCDDPILNAYIDGRHLWNRID